MAIWSSRTVHDVERGSNLDLLLRGANGIGNRLVDALFSIGGGLQAIALALSTTDDNSAEVQKQIDLVADRIKQQADAIQAAVDHAKEK